MAGLTKEGFTPDTLQNIKTRLDQKLDAINPGFDLSPESPDGQRNGIIAAELAILWTELERVYHSYNPNIATGQALENIALLTGQRIEYATRSNANIDLVGTAGTIVPKGSLVSDVNGNQFYTTFDAVIPSTVPVLATVAGIIPVTAGTITTIDSPISGWTSITQQLDGVTGKLPEEEQQFRNRRNETVMRNAQTVQESLKSAIIDLGITQVFVLNNDVNSVASDGTPANTVHVTVGEYSNITDLQIATAIFNNIGMVTPTYGSTSVTVADDQGNNHTIYFTKATEVPIYIDLTVTYLDSEVAGADQAIKDALRNEINAYPTGEDVIISRLYGLVTPIAKAQIDSFKIGKTATTAASNISIADNEFTSLIDANINLVVN